MATNSRRKGKRGELEAAAFLNDLFPRINARRGQQFKATADSPDVVTDWDWLHVEVKRRQRFNLAETVDKAIDEAPDKLVLVLHRKDRGLWLATVPACQLAEFSKRVQGEMTDDH